MILFKCKKGLFSDLWTTDFGMELLKFPDRENFTPDVYHAYRKFSDPSLTTVGVFGHKHFWRIGGVECYFLSPMVLQPLEFISIGSHS